MNARTIRIHAQFRVPSFDLLHLLSSTQNDRISVFPVMENATGHRSIYEATLSCRQRLRQCTDVPALMVEEWPRKRLADFNLWASDSGALAKQTASLDQRLAEKQTVREVILNLLGLLEGLLGRLQNLSVGEDEDGETSLQETTKDVEDIMAQLVRISVAIRRAAQPARLDRADDSFNPQRHEELRQHLDFVILLASLGADQKAGGNADFNLSPEKTCTAVAQRLIWANLLRRHRYLYARRRWMKQSA